MNDNIIGMAGTNTTNPFCNLMEIKFFDVIPRERVICSITNNIFKEPRRLEPCGHVLEGRLIPQLFLETKTKNCPICFAYYTTNTPVEDPFLHDVLKALNAIKCQVNPQFANSINQKYEALPESYEKQQIKIGIDLFLTGNGGINEGILKVVEVITNSNNGDQYCDILNLMEGYQQTAEKSPPLFTPIMTQENQESLENYGIQTETIIPMGEEPRMEEPVIEELLPEEPRMEEPVIEELVPEEPLVQNKKRRLDDERRVDDEPVLNKIARQNFDDDVSSNRHDKDRVTTPEKSVDTPGWEFEDDVIIAKVVPAPVYTRPSLNIKSEPGPKVQPEYSHRVSSSKTENKLIKSLKKKATNIIQLMIPEYVNGTDENGDSPLHLVVENYKYPAMLIKQLFDKNANLNAQNFDGNTPLHVAAVRHREKTIELLLELGASNNITNGDELRPSELTRNKRVKKAFGLMI